MTDDVAIKKLRRHRELGVQILIDFKKATPETAAEMVERNCKWERYLIQLVEPFGDGAAARFKPLTPMRPHEQFTIAHCAPLDEYSTEARICHAVQLYRLDELIERLPLVLPKSKGGNRHTINDEPIIEKARAIMKSRGTNNKAAAVREAAKRFPRLFHGSGDYDNKIKRIVGKM